MTLFLSLFAVSLNNPVSATTDLEDIALNFVNQLKKKQFDAATELFNSEMLAALPAEKGLKLHGKTYDF